MRRCHLGLMVRHDGHDLSFDTPTYALSRCPFDLNAIHAVALPSFLADGGSKTLGFPSVVITHDRGPTDFDAFESYVRKYSPIMQMPEGRITVNYYPEETSAGSRVAAAAGITTLLSLLLAASTVW